jgi:ABC-type multidrug transport system fused ATPase/permease subunit
MSLFEAIPLWAIGVCILGILFIAAEIGFRTPGWLRQRRFDDAPTHVPDYLLSAVLGLLALLLGFSFSLALNRYEARRDLVVQEANAIGTAWLRAQLLEEPVRTALSKALLAYTDIRLAWSETTTDKADNEPTERMQKEVWKLTGRAVREDSSAQLSRALMDAVNESFDSASARLAARSAHIPDRVLQVLLLYAIMSMLMMGYVQGAGARPHRAATAQLVLLLSLALTIILDIDRPRSGAIQVSQQPMIDLRQSFR